ncbi:MAG TPA: hypothetical protein VMX13_09770 [Sedimentisphaerales bacterium]|nr:hypothetical protein [Sedimentisphaerales bacterium]
MMSSNRILGCLTVTVIGLFVLAAGCAAPAPAPPPPTAVQPPPPPPPEQPVNLSLKFAPDDSTTYRLLTEGTRSVTYEGSLANDPSLKGGETGDSVEMTFSQHIRSVNDQGNAVAEITIKQLKFLAKVKSDTVLDFDSSREKDQAHPLAKLIGQSYTIEITPAGQVTRIIDAKEAQAAVKGNATAQRLLESDEIKERHAVAALPAPGNKEVRVDDHWSSIKATDFGMLGAKAYERIYVLKGVKELNGRKVAAIEMNAIPTAETAEQLHKQKGADAFSKMFDNIEQYTGLLDLDLTAGKVQKYVEKLRSEWVIVDPAAKTRTDKSPDALKMTAVSLYSLEMVE